VDLPGTCFLAAYSLEVVTVRNYLKNEKPGMVVFSSADPELLRNCRGLER
jgi:Fe2+ transport system protein B